MSSLVRSLLVTLIVSLGGANSYSDVPASDTPAMVLFRVCRDAGPDVRDAVEALLRAGWKDATSAAARRRVVTERMHMVVRARLSRATYPEGWDDAAVRRSYPSTMARNMDELAAHVRRNIEAELEPSPSRREFVLSSPSGNAVAAILHYPNSIICEIVEKSTEEPNLVHEFHTKFPLARQKGANGGRFFNIDDHNVAIVILSPHARQRSERFPVEFDMSVWMRFPKDSGEN